MPKVGAPTAASIIQKLLLTSNNTVSRWLVKSSSNTLFFHRTPGYWIRIMNFQPYFKSPTADKSIHHIREIHFDKEKYASFTGSVVSSSLYFFCFFSLGNCRNLTLTDVKDFGVGHPSLEVLDIAAKLFIKLMNDYQTNSFINYRGSTEFQEFDWAHSKPIIDEIDTLLAEHYGFTEEELDFIINYDIKYRMGRGSGEEE